MENKVMNQRGFTLVELMVVVAIIGILSAVAIPNFKKYQAKAKTSEAKVQLAGAYTAEQAFYGDYSGYANCLETMGFEPGPDRYFSMGFANEAGGTGALGNAPAACTSGTAAQDVTYWLATKSIGARAIPDETALAAAGDEISTDAQKFLMGSIGYVQDVANPAWYVMTDDKQIIAVDPIGSDGTEPSLSDVTVSDGEGGTIALSAYISSSSDLDSGPGGIVR